MPTFDDPIKDAAEASAALRGLAHATRQFESPADTYPVIGDLLAGVRSLRQVLDQLAAAHIRSRAVAHDDAGNQAARRHLGPRGRRRTAPGRRAAGHRGVAARRRLPALRPHRLAP